VLFGGDVTGVKLNGGFGDLHGGPSLAFMNTYDNGGSSLP
jgi:hypothetical protein